MDNIAKFCESKWTTFQQAYYMPENSKPNIYKDVKLCTTTVHLKSLENENMLKGPPLWSTWIIVTLFGSSSISNVS